MRSALSKRDDGTLYYENYSGKRIIGRNIELKEENFWGDGERHMRVRNLSDHPAYVKATPYFTARDSSGEVCDCIVRDEEYLDLDLENWIKIGESYYYRTPLEGNKYTSFLVKSCKNYSPEGYVIGVRFEISGIDAQDIKTVRDRWKVSVTDEGFIVG